MRLQERNGISKRREVNSDVPFMEQQNGTETKVQEKV